MWQFLLAGKSQVFVQSPRFFVRSADVAGLSGFDDLFAQRIECLFDRHVVIAKIFYSTHSKKIRLACRPMHLIEIEVVGLKAIQTSLYRDTDVLSVRALHVGPRTGNLAREYEVIAFPALQKPRADVFFSKSFFPQFGRNGIYLRRVDKVNALREGVVQLLMPLRLRILLPPVHRTEAYLRYFQLRARNFLKFHTRLPKRSLARK